MISGGLIGGGMADSGAAPPANLKSGTLEVNGASSETMDKFIGNTTMNDFMNLDWGKFWGQEADNLIKTAGSIWTSWIQFDAMTTMNKDRVEAAKHISDNQELLGEKYFNFVENQDTRRNGPDGINERLARIQANTAIDIRQRELDTKERLAALHNVDTVFGFDSRQNYSYGFPQA